MAATDYQTTTHDLLTEDLIPPAAGVEELTGRRPAPTTVWRWLKKGIRGHKLASVRVMGQVFTSREEIRRWLSAVDDARTAAPADADDGDERPEHVRRKLDQAGLL